MKKNKVYTVIGLMSGTSLDGIDAALIRTDGESYVENLAFVSVPYDHEMRQSLKNCLGKREDIDGGIALAEIDMTRDHAAAVDWLLGKAGVQPADIDLIGFHGQTLFHDPAAHFTWQIGKGALLARLTGIDVVNDFRSADVAAGGQGAPLMPLYHQALSSELPKPLAILNIGGVGNITYLGPDDEIAAFDTGPGNALLNDWVSGTIGRDYDENGMLARQGRVHAGILDQWLSDPYFTSVPPKSLDRDMWDLTPLEGLSTVDGAATLTAFTVQAVAQSLKHLPVAPQNWYIAGGGRHNTMMMEALTEALAVSVAPVEGLGWNGDALEAEGFAWLAVRSLRGLPLSLPSTTGVHEALSGGVLHKVNQ